ncbi:carbohydrate binding family 9 domain-containing protein [Thalassomonas viridans]|uniref:Carbohydrate binding family 9 domain-containing protein n=1 Tax=Thalassomonas viridans TaxID=137584 RepID=A0AAF0C8Q7_9GAMM|nr:carbohydrate binding family 9 domain-containing protein [Thalassomonas viridans]WDE04636.1 carbohydrate binding family 9 domain-containing protein [Thalassomonas viridans]
MNIFRIKMLFFIFVGLVLTKNTAIAGTPEGTKDKSPHIPYLQANIVLDGKLDEAIWQQARSYRLSYSTEPFENIPAPVGTQVYVFESGDTLYVGFDARDLEPEKIRAYLRDRDKVWDDDLVGLKLDTYGTQKLAYHFYVNANGVQIDTIESELSDNLRDDWDANWQTATAVSEQGYTAEFAIPLKSMNFSEKDGEKNWRVEFLRWYPREVKYRLSHIPVDRNDSCSLCRLAPIQGFAHTPQSDTLTILPSMVSSYNEKKPSLEDQSWHSNQDWDLGADISWQITSDDLLSATINPDFSQIEADNAQLSLNNNFSLSFPEKRRFFLENQSYFDSMYSLVHTRNIIEPDVGVKYTSRKDQHTLAVLVANDQATHLRIPGNLNSTTTKIDEESINGAFRYRYDFDENASVGMLSTMRQASNYHNYLMSIDSKYRFSESTTLRWHLLNSRSEYPEELTRQLCNGCSTESSLRTRADEELNDSAWQIELDHSSRNWWFNAQHKRNGKDFRADLGSVDKADYKFYQLKSGYVLYDYSIWNKLEFWAGYSKETNINNDLLGDNAEIQLNLNGPMQSKISTGVGTQKQSGLRYDKSTTQIAGNTPMFDLNFAFIYADFRPDPSIFLSTLLRKGDTVDYANNRRAKQFYWQPIVQWDVNRHFNFKVTYTFEDLDSAGDNLYIARLTDLRANYQFSAASKLRFSAIHNNLSFNAGNYLDPRDQNFQSLGTQLVYSYRFNALSTFYLGYSSNAVETDHLGKLVQQERNLFTKLTLSF